VYTEIRMADYVERRREGYYLVASRVSLDSVVNAFRDGALPQSIQQDFPTLTLEQVYGAIAFYLGHKQEIDAYLEETERLWEQGRAQQEPLPSELRERLERARRVLPAKR
jgi:hypothetical protein